MAAWVTIDDVADAAYAAGFRGEPLAIAIAVTKPEAGLGAPSGFWTDKEALGDLTYRTDVYSGSVGAWQVLTEDAAKGTGSDRDRDALFGNLARQAVAAYNIVGGNTTTGSAHPNRGWGHWSTWKDGLHRSYLDAAREAGKRRETVGGTGSISAGGTPTPSTTPALSPDVIGIAPGTLPANVVAPRRVVDLRLAGSAEAFTLDGLVIDGEVNLTVEEASQLSLTLHNAAYVFLGAGRGTAGLRARLTWLGLDFVVAATELAPGAGNNTRVLVQARDPYIDAMKRTNVDASGKAIDYYPGVATAGKNLSPTEYAAMIARNAGPAPGLRLLGEGSARRTDITMVRDDKTGIYESAWEVLNRLATELGFMVFVSGKVLHFGRPTWLASRATGVKVGLTPNAWGDVALDAIGTPSIRDTIDSFHGGTITLRLPRWRGEQVRPGMVLNTAGLSGIPGNVWLVTGVTWPVDNGGGFVTVDAVIPVDEPVQAKTAPEAPDTDPGATAASPGAAPIPSTSAGRASPSVSSRLSTSERIRLFGQPGDRARYTQVATPWGITVTVHRDVAAKFRAACTRAGSASTWRPQRIDSFVVRNVRGGDDYSLHSFALAWDFFSSGPGVPPPGGVWGPESAPDQAFRNAFAAEGFYLGAEFSNRKDYPHIEWAGAPPLVSASHAA